LIIAPLAACCGIAVPMISGRGLGHTGGTLDKLESIEGFNVNLTTLEFRQIIKQCGYAMAGQTAEIAPADKKIYALRDATATVPTIPLIVASIMSKKLAEGLDSLILDVKTGNGAFMNQLKDARRLAEAMVDTGNSCGVKTQALITDMNEPLGKYVGNAHEVYECVKVLRDEIEVGMEPMLEVSIELTARMLKMSEISDSIENAKLKIKKCLESGDALEKFRQNIELQNGNSMICDNPELLLDKDLIEFEIKANETGFVNEIATDEIGKAISAIGGGRLKAEDSIDHAVGYACIAKLGEEINSGETLGILYCRNEAQANSISEKLHNAYKIKGEIIEKLELVKEIID
jgi:pyrimidine-nucleoside phosphorylase